MTECYIQSNIIFNYSMIRNLKVNKLSLIVLIYFCLMLVYWVGLHFTGKTDQNINLLYSFSLNTLSFVGGIIGVFVSLKWGGFRSVLGKGLLLMSLGLISWGAVGGYIWSYYNFILHQEVPYPSLSDVGFIAAVPLWAFGMFFLAKATGVKYALKNKAGKAYLFFLPIVSLAASYYLLVTVARDGSVSDGGSFVKVFFDFAYPIGDVIIITIALLIFGLTLKLLGGMYRNPIHILLAGFVAMFFADMAFSYTTTIETYYNGNYADLFFTTALFLMSFGIASFALRPTEEGSGEIAENTTDNLPTGIGSNNG